MTYFSMFFNEKKCVMTFPRAQYHGAFDSLLNPKDKFIQQIFPRALLWARKNAAAEDTEVNKRDLLPIFMENVLPGLHSDGAGGHCCSGCSISRPLFLSSYCMAHAFINNRSIWGFSCSSS